jgi:hypothetical protein
MNFILFLSIIFPAVLLVTSKSGHFSNGEKVLLNISTKKCRKFRANLFQQIQQTSNLEEQRLPVSSQI